MDILKMLLPYFAIAAVLGILSKILTNLLKPSKKNSGIGKVEYKKCKSITTDRELKFYKAIKQIADAKRLVVFSKVRLADLIEPRANKNGSEYQSNFNRIKSKHVDFVLCDSISLCPILVIEVDDSTHERDDRKQRDKFVDEAMKSADLKILHVYEISELAEKISKALK